MLIVSWNVAGLSTTLSRIESDYKPPSDFKSTTGDKNHKSISSSFSYYLERHHIDIIAIQEHKIPLSQLSSRSEPFCVASRTDGYESFWSCNTCNNNSSSNGSKSKAKAGMNGVCTFAREGLTISASSTILEDPELDHQGRCLMTDHGSFVLFNVYVPCREGENKIKFLTALRQAMSKQRQKGKKVILVGDLNISHKPIDIYWKWLPVSIQRVYDEVNSNTLTSSMNWTKKICYYWPIIYKALKTWEVLPRQTRNVETNEVFEKYQVCVTVDNKKVFLGKAENTREEASCNFENITMEEEGADIVLSLDFLIELIFKINGEQVDIETQKLISNSNCIQWREKDSRQWLDTILNNDGMVDAFRKLFPFAKGRFTVWHQYTNRRYFNEGSRIDYTLVDDSLENFIQKRTELRCGGVRCEHNGSDCDESAFCAATASNRYQPASFGGGGIITANQKVLDTQFGVPHTGIIYTPPTYSDHVAVSLYLSLSINSLDLNEKDSDTKKTQPHKVQKSISDFFGQRKRSSCSANKSTAKLPKMMNR